MSIRGFLGRALHKGRIRRQDRDARRRLLHRRLLGHESLEDRRVLTTLFWQGDVDNSFSTAGNWNTAQDGTGSDQAPVDMDVLVFDTNTVGIASFTPNNDIVGLANVEIQIVDDSAANAFTIGGNGVTLAAAGITRTGTDGSVNFLSLPVTLTAAASVTNNTATGTNLDLGAIDTAGFTLTSQGSGTTEISGVVSGAGGITVNHSGSSGLILSGNNTHTATIANDDPSRTCSYVRQTFQVDRRVAVVAVDRVGGRVVIASQVSDGENVRAGGKVDRQ